VIPLLDVGHESDTVGLGAHGGKGAPAVKTGIRSKHHPNTGQIKMTASIGQFLLNT